MRHATILFVILCGVVLSSAQSYNITGVVKNSAGTGIEGVTVRLGTADISSKTGSDGHFTLSSSSAVFPSDKAVSNMQCPVVLRNGKFSFVTAHQGKVRLMVYDCNGKLRASFCESVSPGNNTLSLPRFANGLYIYNMVLDGKQYTFKSIAGTAANSSEVTAISTINSAKLAKTAAVIDDNLLAFKSGYQLFNLEITNSDTSGIQITLIPWETGTLTDINGFVYHTIKIGNQVWTVENIRTTKYNDGTPIAHLIDTEWNTTTQGAYCFYNNSTDPAFQQKWGAYYNWFAVGSGKLAPTGWRVSKLEDWDTLTNYLYTHGYTYNGALSCPSVVKSLAAETDWSADTNSMAVGNDLSRNNISGFSALPGGCCYAGSKFNSIDTVGYWWTTDVYTDQLAAYRCLASKDNILWVPAFATPKNLGLSVRLIKE